MERTISIGAVSWIDRAGIPDITGYNAASAVPAWVTKTIYGLQCTSNRTPPAAVADFRRFESGRDFRALMFCKVRVDIDDRTGRLRGFAMLDAVHNPGWTPPFDLDQCPSGFFVSAARNSTISQGEASPISVVYGQRRHYNTTLPTMQGEMLAHGLIKFRAGAATDRAGTNLGSPHHVPWVWCEMALAFDQGRFHFQGRGALYPSHAWYVNGRRVGRVDQLGDSHVVVLPGGAIDLAALNMLPALTAGAPNHGKPQVPATRDAAYVGAWKPVDGQPFALRGGRTIRHAFA